MQPFRKGSNRLDDRNWPLSGSTVRLHDWSRRKPLSNAHRLAMNPQRSRKPFIRFQKVNNAPSARPHCTSETRHKALRHWANPAPAVSKGLHQPRGDRIFSRLARHHRIRQRRVEPRSVHRKMRRSTPTKLALRDPFHAARGEDHPMNLQLFTFPWGNPGEDRIRTQSSDASPAWPAPPHQHHTSLSFLVPRSLAFGDRGIRTECGEEACLPDLEQLLFV